MSFDTLKSPGKNEHELDLSHLGNRVERTRIEARQIRTNNILKILIRAILLIFAFFTLLLSTIIYGMTFDDPDSEKGVLFVGVFLTCFGILLIYLAIRMKTVIFPIELEVKLTEIENHLNTLEHNFETNSNKSRKECPMCAEMIMENAKKCRFCNYEIVPKELE